MIVIALLLLSFSKTKLVIPISIVGIAALVLYAVPIIGAYRIASKLNSLFANNAGRTSSTVAGSAPFKITQMVTGVYAKKIAYKTLSYDSTHNLSLDFYPSQKPGNKPCVVIVHGGSWAAGNSQQLPDLNSALAKAGYHVASINYRLAPEYKFPAPIEDLHTALDYLRSVSANLSVDTTKFVLLGRSAGGQIVLSAAYTLNDPAIKGVISFYGPADMVWGYANPTNPLVLDSKKVIEDYLGGTDKQVPQQYINSSATETATSNSVSTLLIHGENDPLVSHLHGIRLGKKLDNLKVRHYDVYLPWATHGFDYTLNGPAGQLSTWSVLRFLEIVL
ncbi:esterase [Segetibacter aerophilus]|uniref:Esterase n=1 Tax=Segetibacter aerophilus TaxID=670293 RepID=A0A512BJU3_9BACT|nr:esterase [Segetibacter aerophilus]